MLEENIATYNENRIYLEEEPMISTDRSFKILKELEEVLGEDQDDANQQYDMEAAAEVLAAVFPDRDPRSKFAFSLW